MKVLIQLISNHKGRKELGRLCWITKDIDGKLSTSNIYSSKDKAAVLSKDDYISLKSYESQGAFKIISIE